MEVLKHWQSSYTSIYVTLTVFIITKVRHVTFHAQFVSVRVELNDNDGSICGGPTLLSLFHICSESGPSKIYSFDYMGMVQQYRKSC